MSGSRVDGARPPAPERRTVDSAELFHGTREVVIVHRREECRLHVTRSDKLILTK